MQSKTFYVRYCAVIGLLMLLSACSASGERREAGAQFNVFVITSMAKDHQKMMAAAMPMLHLMAAENHFHVDITNDAEAISDETLSHYQVLVMLQEAPFDLSPTEQGAIERFVEKGHGWVGIHAAGIPSREYTGRGVPYWAWYETLIGGPKGLQYSPHPAYQPATLVVEDRGHPATRHLPAEMRISDEWYEFNQSVRDSPGIRVLASVDESTYKQNKPMGDHPMIWTNENFHRAIYICIGHDPTLVANADYQILLRDSILWAADAPEATDTVAAKPAATMPAAGPTSIVLAEAPAPQFDDPVWHGATDPFVIWNPVKKQWWMFYTQRRSTLANPVGVDWVHGSAIGIATSADGTHWSYLGTAQGDHDLSDPLGAMLTWWAPCFLQTGDTFHMWVVQVDGIYTKWVGKRHILHFTSSDLLHWKYADTPALSSERVIDPTVYNVGGTWYMVYKDEAHGSHTWLAHSADLSTWTVDKEIVGGSGHEAPFVWHWKNAWWLIVDGYGKGLKIYRSENGVDQWVYNNTVLPDRSGTRARDNTVGHHPGVVMQGDQTIVYYFTEFPDHHTYIQIAELELSSDGKVICDRNKYAATR